MILIYGTTTEWLALWCLSPLSTIFHLYRGCKFFLVGKTEVPVENHRPAASHWQTLSHNVISSTPRLIGIRTQNTTGYSRINRSISSWYSTCAIYLLVHWSIVTDLWICVFWLLSLEACCVLSSTMRHRNQYCPRSLAIRYTIFTHAFLI